MDFSLVIKKKKKENKKKVGTGSGTGPVKGLKEWAINTVLTRDPTLLIYSYILKWEPLNFISY